MSRVLAALLCLCLSAGTYAAAQLSRFPGDSLQLWLAAVFACAAVVSLVAAVHSAHWSALVVLNLGAIAAGLIAGDAYFGIRAWQVEMAQTQYLAQSPEPRSILQITADLRRKQGIPAVPLLYPKITGSEPEFRTALKLDQGGILPLGGIGNSRTVLCTEPGTVIDYLSDQHGFNNPANAWNDTARFLMLGDSFTQGFCVPNGSSFADLIRTLGGGAINLGAAGNGPITELAGLREYGPLTSATDILWFFYEGNDFADVVRESSTPALSAYLNPSYRRNVPNFESVLFERLEQVVAAKIAENRPVAQPTLNLRPIDVLMLRHIRQAFGLGFNDEYGALKSRLKMAATALKHEADEGHRQLHLVYLPSFGQLIAPVAIRSAHKDMLQSIIKDAGIDWIDVTPRMVEMDTAELFVIKSGPYRGHYSELGHRIVAETVMDALTPKPKNLAPGVP